MSSCRISIRYGMRKMVYAIRKNKLDKRKINQRNNNSHGLRPVCFLKAVEKCEIEE